MKTSIKELECLVELLNQKVGVPNKYQLQGAYGGWKLTNGYCAAKE